MPRRDGTGPMGDGPITGRGLGSCTGANAARRGGTGLGMGLGLGRRRGFGGSFGGGFGRGFFINQNPTSSKESLEEQKRLLKSQLEAIDKQLEDL